MKFTSCNIPLPPKIPVALIFLSALIFFSCQQLSNKQSASAQSPKVSNWYRQAIVDLGNRIIMFSSNDGLAISNGRGNIPGKLYRFEKGEWKPFYEYEYSDYPLIAAKDSKNIWSINHLTHNGAYRPVHSAFVNGKQKEIPLPKIMWDAIDHVMYKGIFRFADGTAWMVGQQGHILFYNGKNWKEVESPLYTENRSIVFEGDLNDVFMTSRNSGWAVGRSGVIIRYENGNWKKFFSPTELTLNRVAFVNDSIGWAVGERGIILRWNGKEWNIEKTDVREQLNSIKAVNEHDVWIVGMNSTLLHFDGKSWSKDESIKLYDDHFQDIDIVNTSSGEQDIWIIGATGIYTNAQSMGFSFTDATTSASLPHSGKAGIFFHRSKTDEPDLYLIDEGKSNSYYENIGSGRFIDATKENDLLDAPRDGMVTAFGDVNNDGEMDLLQIMDHEMFRLYFGTVTGRFRDATEFSQLKFNEINSASNNAAKFIDLDNDGDLDLYISNCNLPDQIFLNDGTGRFADATSRAKISKILNHTSYGASFSDVNGDGNIDIFIPYYVSLNGKFFDLFINNGDATFTGKDDSSFYFSYDISPTVTLANDFNNDGFTDIFVFCQQKHPPLLFMNDGKGNFHDASAEAGLTALTTHPEPLNGTAAAADVNNDGTLDIFASSKLFLHSSSGKFIEVAERVGIQFIGTPTFADIDNDGDEDLFIGSSRQALGKGDRAVLFRNNLDDRNFIKVRAFGDESNRLAIGAKVLLLRNDTLLQMREVGLGSNPTTSQNLTEVHFGVPSAGVYSIKVKFPSGRESEMHNIERGSTISVFESSSVMRWGILSMRSIARTVKMLQWQYELLKFILTFVLFISGILFGKNFGVQSFVRSWQFGTGYFLLYALLVHLFISEPIVTAFAGTILTQLLISGVAFVTARVVIQQREAKYISHYKILDLIGAGGMGKVYKALDTNTKQIVALKVLNQELLKDPENRRRLSAEGHLLASFDHPNIVRVFEIGESHERGFIAMEFLTGGTLREKLEKSHPLSIDEIKRYVLQVCDGLSEVHSKGIVHRDLKTGNLMLDQKGNICIMDFGLSKSPLVTTMTSLGTVLGTLGYVAPEQVTSVNVDQRTDIFSLGVIMYELMTNELPFKGENEIALIHAIFNTVPPLPSTLRSDMPKDWDAVVMKCLAKDANERFGSAEEVKSKLIIDNS